MIAPSFGLDKLKQLDTTLYDKIKNNCLFIDFFKILFLLESIRMSEPLDSNVEKIARFILGNFELSCCENAGCAICLQDIKPEEGMKSMNCKHCFHKACYSNWLKVNFNCPLCRQSVFSD